MHSSSVQISSLQLPKSALARRSPVRRSKKVQAAADREVTLLDYGAGNVRSVRNALIRLGCTVKEVCSRLILRRDWSLDHTTNARFCGLFYSWFRIFMICYFSHASLYVLSPLIHVNSAHLPSVHLRLDFLVSKPCTHRPNCPRPRRPWPASPSALDLSEKTCRISFETFWVWFVDVICGTWFRTRRRRCVLLLCSDLSRIPCAVWSMIEIYQCRWQLRCVMFRWNQQMIYWQLRSCFSRGLAVMDKRWMSWLRRDM